MATYEKCPNCQGTIISKRYKKHYGQCKSCYEADRIPLGVRIDQKL